MEVVRLERKVEVNQDAVEMVEAVLGRLRSGETLAVGIIEHRANGGVSTIVSESKASYHQLNSGAARLAHVLAGMGD